MILKYLKILNWPHAVDKVEFVGGGSRGEVVWHQRRLSELIKNSDKERHGLGRKAGGKRKAFTAQIIAREY